MLLLFMPHVRQREAAVVLALVVQYFAVHGNLRKRYGGWVS